MVIITGPKVEKERVFVLGLDGFPFSLMKDLTEGDLLLNFKSLLSKGSIKRMNSVLPCVSSVAWASYMTGVNPAKHNIFGFIDRVPQSMEMFVPTSTHLSAETLWEWLSRNGKRVVVINVPGTYPPRRVNGILIAGFLCANIDKIAYPKEVAQDLKVMGYRIDIDSWKARKSTDEFLFDVNDALEKRFEAAFRLLNRIDWDFFQLHVMETDRINHFLWTQWKEGDSLYGPLFLEFYQKLDSYLGTLVDRIGDGTKLMVLSDHGFCGLKREVYLNHWLEREGFLKMRKESDSLAAMHPESKAYSLFPGRIYVNLRGREATGTVGEGRDYEMTRENLMSALLEVHDPENGEPFVERVLKREEVYKGPYLSSAPDLVAIPRRGYDLKGTFSKPTLTAASEVTGIHTYDDALLYVRDREIRGSDNAFGIMDAYAAALKLTGMKKPQGIEAEDLI
ncbi:MAG: nucleotide pyrophosphatase [Proteobacteria bacterium]|nr:nucleotide pyrophosphatase [Pseudomonadota bacterium]NIS70335.1 nucleotide pyrophosphatase [Pseudomonadota bacterium]